MLAQTGNFEKSMSVGLAGISGGRGSSPISLAAAGKLKTARVCRPHRPMGGFMICTSRSFHHGHFKKIDFPCILSIPGLASARSSLAFLIPALRDSLPCSGLLGLLSQSSIPTYKAKRWTFAVAQRTSIRTFAPLSTREPKRR